MAITEQANKLVNGIDLPAYVSSVTVSRRGGQYPGCVIDVKIANHIFTIVIKQTRKLSTLREDLQHVVTDRNNDNLAIAIGKTVVHPDRSYGWSSVDTLRKAGVSLLAR